MILGLQQIAIKIFLGIMVELMQFLDIKKLLCGMEGGNLKNMACNEKIAVLISDVKL